MLAEITSPMLNDFSQVSVVAVLALIAWHLITRQPRMFRDYQEQIRLSEGKYAGILDASTDRFERYILEQRETFEGALTDLRRTFQEALFQQRELDAKERERSDKRIEKAIGGLERSVDSHKIAIQSLERLIMNQSRDPNAKTRKTDFPKTVVNK